MAGSKTIFVANIPFDTSEEQLARVFSEAGPVQGVDIKFGPDGKPRGFGFIQFYDEAAAASAVRNLNGVEVNDRSLRIEASSDTPNHRQAGRGGPGAGQGAGGGGRGPPPRGGRDRSSPPPPFRPPPPGAGYGMPPPGGVGGYGGPPPPMGGGMGMGGGIGMGMGMGGPPGPPGRADLGMLPPGIELPRGENALDGITKTLAGISPGQLQDVMAGMKVLISTQPDQARQLLTTKPQLAYALFQAMIQLNIVDPQVVQQIQALPAPGQNQNQYQPPQSNYPPPQPPSSYPPPSNYNQPPPQTQAQAPYPPASNDPRLNSYRPPPPTQGSGYGAPPPQNYPPPAAAAPAAASGISPEVQDTLNTLPADQRETLMAVLQMSPDQINALDPTQRASVMQLRQQFLGV